MYIVSVYAILGIIKFQHALNGIGTTPRRLTLNGMVRGEAGGSCTMM